MPRFINKRDNKKRGPARGIYTIRKGIGQVEMGKYELALRKFRSVASSRHPKTTRLVKSVASGYTYHTERLLREGKKASRGNAHLMSLHPGNSGDAWSDVDIAMVLVAPKCGFTTRFLAHFLGRTEEAIRFQRRYASGRLLGSWSSERGNRYTRFTQNQKVAGRLGV